MTRRRKDWLIGLTIACVSVALILILAAVRQGRSREDVISRGGEKIAIVELLGPIYDSRRIVRQIETYGEQKSIRGILLRIDSPGGLVVPSQEIYESVRRVRDGGKPVLAFMGSVAASGGYYAACGADTLMAQPGTTTGSIGVIAEFMHTYELFRKIGIKFEIIKSGPYKDLGSPHRGFTEADRRHLQAWIDDAFDQFVTVVAESRRMTRREALRIADGRVFTGRQALAIGLVDTLGYYRDAVDLTARMAGIEGEPTVVRERTRRITLIDLFLEQIEGVLHGFGGTRLKYQYQ